jgi:hypothetical protein
MTIKFQIPIYFKNNRVQASHEIRGTICRKVLDKTFDLEFFYCIHTVLYSIISRFIGDFASHFSIYGCLSTVVSYLLYIIKKKRLYCFWGIYPPYPLAPRITLGIYTSYPYPYPGYYLEDSLIWARFARPIRVPIKSTTWSHVDVSLGTTRSQGAMGDVSPRGTFRFPHAQSMVTLRVAIAAHTK